MPKISLRAAAVAALPKLNQSIHRMPPVDTIMTYATSAQLPEISRGDQYTIISIYFKHLLIQYI